MTTKREWLEQSYQSVKERPVRFTTLSDMAVETPETVAARIRRVLPYAPAADITVAPDCGMKYLPRDVAFAKMKAMVAGAAMVRGECVSGS